MSCLKNSTLHEWVQFVPDYFFAATLLHVIHRFHSLNRALACLLPQSLLEKHKAHSELAITKVRRRLQTNTARPDFIHHMMKAADADTISKEQLEKQASILILAGSETTSVALTFVTFHLIQHKDKFTRLRSELGVVFTNESDIDIVSANELPYLHAVI
ncbi:cytochrome P450 [Aspergillus campestris IBT 28561]|uniref:Cytochrome P450 n=1 Tax=Aspergillus campestris (strain IBT 28561) TaxID=1392248 RepID=A0A2I1CWK8_ASPC2|nr:cytochrome P450 [Aspergillus campestris IBT 28561]PKY02011.1 cytochrome P450 [Aspergillus campestris IBT 28561]